MAELFSKSKRNELGMVLKDALARGLRPLFKVYAELLKKADPYNYELSCSLEELSQSLEFTTREVQCVLEDLTMLELIRFNLNEEAKQWNIKLLVY